MIGVTQLKTIQEKHGVFLLVYGSSGYGKTASIRSFPQNETAIICSEPQGLTTLVKFGWVNARVVCPTTSDAFLAAVEEVLCDDTVRYIVVDSLSQHYEMLIKEYVSDFNKSAESLGRDMYRVAGLKFQKMCRRLLDALPMGKDVIGLVHLNYREDTSSEDRKNIREPALPGQLPQWIARQASLVARAEKVRVGKDIRYLLLADGVDGDYGKDIFGVLSSMKTNDLWPILQEIKKDQPVPIANGQPKVTGYGNLLAMAARAKVSKPELDAMINMMRIDPKKATPEEWEKIEKEFVAKFNPPF